MNEGLFLYDYLEHIVSIISSLLKNCSGPNKQRVINKFTENDFEKIDRLLELYFKYSEEVEKIEKSIEDDDEVSKSQLIVKLKFGNLRNFLKESDDEREIENYMLKLENGLFALQSIVYIILDISVNGPQSVYSLSF